MLAIRQGLVVASAMLFATFGVLAYAAKPTLNGVLRTGGTASSTPIPNAAVSLFEATNAQPTLVGQATTDASGRFAIAHATRKSSSIFYLRAELGSGVHFVTVLGAELPASATINELTTVAASYAMAQFLRTGVIAGDGFALQLAAGMSDNLVSSATGASSPVMLASPNADQTNSLRSTRSLANLLAACVGNASVTASFFALTTSPGGGSPANTAQAMANLARDPARNVDAIHALTLLSSAYLPRVAAMPDAWTITVKVNATGSDALGLSFGGPGNLAFDQRGYAWVTNNVVQGTPYSTWSAVVLKPNGQPADGRQGTPVSPLTGGGLLGTGFGVAVDAKGFAYFGNFGWGGCSYCNPTPTTTGSISKFTSSGAAMSQPHGYQGGPLRAQGLVTDVDGNLWISSFGNDSVYVFPKGNPQKAVGFQQEVGSGPFDIALAADGSAWVSNGLGVPPTSVAKFRLVNGALVREFRHFVGQGLRGLSVDAHGNAWVASQGDSFVYAFRPDGTQFGQFSGGGMHGPWDTAIDGEENVWVANFGPLQPGSDFSGRLTKLCGSAHRCPPGKNVGDPLSPGNGFTVPSAGSEVLLHNGDPLYGPGEPPSFIPMMRQTGLVIDRAGNLWTINNWKPRFDNDAFGNDPNPGGDGIIIFVGIAPPRAN